MKTFLKIIPVVLLALLPSKVSACAACYGQVESPLADGMNWGIFTLFGIIISMLGCIATFFIFIIRRSAMLAAAAEKNPTPPPSL